jgi:hypothetical protein
MTHRQIQAQRKRRAMTAGDRIRRNADIRRQYFADAISLEDLAKAYNLTPNRIRQIINDASGGDRRRETVGILKMR